MAETTAQVDPAIAARKAAVQRQLAAQKEAAAKAANPDSLAHSYAIKRQQVEADTEDAVKTRREAVERQLANKGIDDSGIKLGQQRTAEVDARRMGALQRNALMAEEGQQRFHASEAEKGRELVRSESALGRVFQGGQADKDRDIQWQSLAQAKELATAGMDIQKASLALQEKGMNKSDAQYYAGLSQAKYLAEKGLDNQAVALALQKQGMDQQNAQYYAGLAQNKELTQESNKIQRESLAQAKELTLAGLDLQKTQVALQEKGMDQEDARYYAGLSQAGALAARGLDLQTSAQELTRQGMDQQNAQYYAGLAQSMHLAERGLDLEEVRTGIQQQGIDNQNAQFFAGLGQAKYLAEQGFSRQDMQIALQEKGMDQQGAQYYAGLAFQEKLSAQQQDDTVKNLYLAEAIAGVDPKDVNYQQKIYDLIKKNNPESLSSAPESALGAASNPDSNRPAETGGTIKLGSMRRGDFTSTGTTTLPSGTKTPPNGNMIIPTNYGYPLWWNPDTGRYESEKNQKYAQYYPEYIK